ncbi:MAG: SDR family oxidoreductase [Lentisphaeria bacterium]|nr:SDR family oxidoreductase [Lentisphaeria bacterium]
MNNTKHRCFFITGATGLVGGYLLDRLVRDRDAEIHVLVRAEDDAAARDRVKRLGQYFSIPDLAENVGIHVGKITEPGLGLPPTSLELLRTRVTDVVHVAASISFTDTEANQRVNCDGTARLLDFIPGDARFFYVSTAYVAGLAPRLGEDQLDLGQGFRNDYERSKFEAERFVRETFRGKEGLLTVLRPSIVTGEWRTGRTFQFMTVYRVLRALTAYARRHPRDPFSMEYTPDGTQNYIPVDRLTDMMVEILRTPRCWGATYHLVNDKPIINREFKVLIEDRFGFPIINRAPDETSNNLNRAAVAGNAAYLAYLGGEPVFGCEARNSLLSAREPMPFDRDYLDRLLTFCDHSAWGRHLVIRR